MQAPSSTEPSVRTELSLKDVEQTLWPVLLQPSGLWPPWVVWATVIGAYLVLTRGVPEQPAQGLELFGIAALASLAAVAFSVIIKRAGVLSATRRRPGVIGPHDYILREDGLFERTSAGEHLTPWARVKGTRALREHLLIETTGDALHVIPSRAFASEAELSAFRDAVARRAQGGA